MFPGREFDVQIGLVKISHVISGFDEEKGSGLSCVSA